MLCSLAEPVSLQALVYCKLLILKCMAERVGFEPTLEFPLNTLSKRAPSTTRPSLLRLFYLFEFNIPGQGDALPLPRHGTRAERARARQPYRGVRLDETVYIITLAAL